MKKSFSLIMLVVFGQLSLVAQTNVSHYASEILRDKNDRIYFVKFKENQQAPQQEAGDFLNMIFFNQGHNKLNLKSTDRDATGFTHLRYTIVQDGSPLAGKLVIAHCFEGKLVSANGDLFDYPQATGKFTITKEAALGAALRKVGAKKYKWENKAEETHMKEVLNQPDFTFYPQGKQVMFEKNNSLLPAYIFTVYAEEPLYRGSLTIDASTGNVLDEVNLICHADVPGSAATKYSGTQTITCDQNGTQYRLKEVSRGLGIETYNLLNGTTYASNNFTSASTTWALPVFDQGALDAHWGAEKTYDYFWNQHARNSINNAGFKLLSYVHYSSNYSNAFWDGLRMTYGDGNGTSMKIFTTLDICGHEISHGLTENTANLVYSYESGALNESFSDIFGTCIENYARPSNWNWKIGEDMTSTGNGLRNMSLPNAYSDPDTYLGSFWYTGTGDNGGVHTNSGVSNYWFYLLTSGGSGTNDISNSYNVTGIGITKAAQIAFRALTIYFTPTTNYAQARSLTIQAAIDLFGQCSAEVIQTTKAWYAVGVGADYIQGVISPNFNSALANFCTLPAVVNFNNTTPNGLSYVWDFGDGSATVTTPNPIHTYTANGSYNVKLKATGCNSVIDSITKSAFVVVNVPPAPQVVNSNICVGNQGTLTVTAPNNIKWFTDPQGIQLFHFGSTYSLASQSSSSTYYVANTTPGAVFNGGLMTNTGGGYLANSAQWLVFNVIQTSTLNTVVVYCSSTSPGPRTIELRNSANSLLNVTTVTLSAGSNTVPLYFPLTIGTNYRLGLSTSSNANLYRTNSNVSYPYNVGSAVSIINSSAGPGAYYWFYNWEVVIEDCSSPLVPVTVSIIPNPVVTLASDMDVICLDQPATLSGLPSGGVYSGPSVSGSQFIPASVGPGTYTLFYNYMDSIGCGGSASKVIDVNNCTGIDNASMNRGFEMYPNPTSDVLYIQTGNNSPLNLRVSDATGRLVYEVSVTNEHQMKTNQLAAGVYILMLVDSNGKTVQTEKVIKQ